MAAALLAKKPRFANLPCLPTARTYSQGTILFQEMQGMLERPDSDAADAEILGMLVKLARMQRILAGTLATAGGDCTVFTLVFQGWGQVSGMFWGPNVWAGLRAGEQGGAGATKPRQRHTCG